MPIIYRIESSHDEEDARVRESNERRFNKRRKVKNYGALILQYVYDR